jgi:hypothetical protein
VGGGRSTVFVLAAVSPTRGATSMYVADKLTPLVSAGGGSGGTFGKSKRNQTNAPAAMQQTPLVPLSEVLDALVPPSVDAFLLLVDAQGFDTDVVLSAGRAYLQRFRCVAIECQEIWAEHPDRMSKMALTCRQAITTLRRHAGLAFVSCMRTNYRVGEWNCLFTQSRRALHRRRVVAPDGG